MNKKVCRLLTLALVAAAFLAFAAPAWATPADLDPSFDSDGKTITNFNARCAGDFATDAVIQSDGKIIVAGSAGDCLDGRASAIARYNSDGSLDDSFGSGGKVVTAFYEFGSGDAYVSDVALQSDGKIVVAVDSAKETIVARYNSDGSPDTSFGDQGQVRGTGRGASAVAVREDGKIVMAGYRYTGGGYEFLLLSYNADGSPDTGFGINGQQSTAFGSGNGFTGAYDLALQDDGKIVVVGRVHGGGMTSDNDFFAVARYNPDGSLDQSFDGDGKLTTSTSPGSDGASSVAIQEDGKILVGGYSYDLTDRKYRGSLARYSADGSLDTSFGENGTLISPMLQFIEDLAVQTDGKIIAPGTRENTFVVARYGADGSPDATFGNGGSTSTDFYGDTYGGAASVAIQEDGKIVAAGRSYGGTDQGFAVARYVGGNEKVAPTTTVTLSQQPNANGWHKEDVTVTLNATDNEGGSGVDRIVYNAGEGTQIVEGDSVEIRVTKEGYTGIAYQAIDNAGNQEEYTTYGVKLDKTKPEVNCGTADGQWHKDDVSIGCTATDGGSGIADADNSFSLSTNVPNDTEDANASTGSRTISDAAGNTATAGLIGGNKVDRKAPGVSLTTPEDGASYDLNASVAADYSCSDGGSGIASCAGNVESGAQLDTSSLGDKSFLVTAEDAAGNSATRTHSYTVVDGALPDTRITSAPRFHTNDVSPTFSFEGSDNTTAVEDMLFSHKLKNGPWSEYSADTSVTLGGAEGLAEGTYIFYVRAKDGASNEDASPAQKRFIVDTTTPKVVRKYPVAEATEIGPGTNVSAVFSEPLHRWTINKNTFKLYEKGASTAVAASVTYDATRNRAILNPTANLKRGVTYKAVASPAIKDLAGNALGESEFWFFTIRK